MNENDRNEESTLKRVIALEEALKDKNREIYDITYKEFAPKPKEPIHKQLGKDKENYPFINIKKEVPCNRWIMFGPMLSLILSAILSSMKFGKELNGEQIPMLLSIASGIVGSIAALCIPWAIAYNFVILNEMRKKRVKEITTSTPYQNTCKEIDIRNTNRQKELDAKYEKAVMNYKQVLSTYEKDLEDFKVKQRHGRSKAIDEKDAILADLNKLYADTRIVPVQYRKLDALKYIYDIVSTSNYDVTYAIEAYNKKLQQDLEHERVRKQEEANRLQNEANQYAQYQAELMEEQNDIANKMKRDQNIANAAAFVQRHNLNKHLKGK